MKRIVMLVLVAMLVASCSDSKSAVTTTTLPKTCDALAEEGFKLMEFTAARIDFLVLRPTTTTVDETTDTTLPNTVPGLLEQFRTENANLLALQTSLKCDYRDIDAFFCERAPSIVVQTALAKTFVADLIQGTCSS